MTNDVAIKLSRSSTRGLPEGGLFTAIALAASKQIGSPAGHACRVRIHANSIQRVAGGDAALCCDTSLFDPDAAISFRDTAMRNFDPGSRSTCVSATAPTVNAKNNGIAILAAAIGLIGLCIVVYALAFGLD